MVVGPEYKFSHLLWECAYFIHSHADVPIIVTARGRRPRNSNRSASAARRTSGMETLAAGAFTRAADDVELDRSLYSMIELEGRRYSGFFAQLDARGEGSIPRAAAVAFFAKSSLSDAVCAPLLSSARFLPSRTPARHRRWLTLSCE